MSQVVKDLAVIAAALIGVVLVSGYLLAAGLSFAERVAHRRRDRRP